MRNSSGIERHIPDIGFGDRLFAGVLYIEDSIETVSGRVCNFLWAARSRLIDVGGDSVTK